MIKKSLNKRIFLILASFIFLIFAQAIVTATSTYNVETYNSSTYSTVKTDFAQGQTVYGKGTTDSSAWIRLEFRNPSTSIVQTCSAVSGTSTTCNYILPSNAPTGTWQINIEKDIGGGIFTTQATDTFNVYGVTDNLRLIWGLTFGITDSDSDGLTDVYELFTSNTDPTNPDTDGDGILDGADASPTNPDANNNGIVDGKE